MRRSRPFRPPVGRLLLRSAAVAAAVVLTVVLAEQPSRSAFTAATGTGSSSVTASSNFCASSGGTTLTPTADSTGYESSASTPYGSNVSLGVISAASANARAVVGFGPLPIIPAHCSLTATLRLRASSAQSGRNIDVYRIDPAASWTEAGINWTTLPATTGSYVSSPSLGAAGWQEWTVTPLMTGLYAGNNGFLLRDRTDSAGPSATQIWHSRDSATAAYRPQLVLSWS